MTEKKHLSLKKTRYINTFEENSSPDNNLILLNPQLCMCVCLYVYRVSLQLLLFTLYNRYISIASETRRAVNLPTLVYIYQLSIIYTGYNDLYSPAVRCWIAIAQNAQRRKVVGSSVAARRSETCYGDLTCSLNYMDRDLLRALFDGNDSSKLSILIWDKI